MRISLQWLRRYIETDLSAEEIGAILTSRGLEVEKIEYPGKKFDGFVVGEVLSVRKHPNADKLSVCLVKVNAGVPDGVQIVCGAPNVAAGQRVPVGLAGAVVPKNQHDPEGKPFTLAKVKIRGEESNGMICSEHELGVGTDASGIMVLPQDAAAGTLLAAYFGLDDVAFEIGVTPNRPDCLQHFGVAREIASALGRKLKVPRTEVASSRTAPSIQDQVTIRVENPDACPRYSARMVRNVHVAPSPAWLQRILTTAGLRPINNVVDVTNFVMLELGQPLHAFDFEKLNGRAIVVKNAVEGEKFTTLDGKEHTMHVDALMICDAERAVAVAGVMGGQNSEISGTTTTVLIESAYFVPASVRRTSKMLGVSTDSSQRFERGTDPNGTMRAADRAAQLLEELAAGEILNGAIDIYPREIAPRVIAVRTKRVNSILGTRIAASRMKKDLQSIGIGVKAAGKGVFNCTIPTFRPDMEQEIDVVEEVARMFGYDNIEDKMVSAIDFSSPRTSVDMPAQIRQWLVGNGLNEIITNSLMEEECAKLFSEHPVILKNPISKDLAAMRPSSLPSLLQTVFHNQNHGVQDVAVFEFGRIYERSEKESKTQAVAGFSEKKVLALAMSGKRSEKRWFAAEEPFDIFHLKGVVESLLRKIVLDKFSLICYDSSSALTDETIAIEINGTYAGFIGKVKQDLKRHFQIESEVYVAEINLDFLLQVEKGFRHYSPISKYPSVSRDLAFIVDADVTVENMEKRIKQSGGALLTEVSLFDVFQGEALPKNKKSVAFSLEFNSAEKTLEEKEIDAALARIVTEVKTSLSAELRSA
jgi:phenylalanyl-tRNA synthetase beta chain